MADSETWDNIVYMIISLSTDRLRNLMTLIFLKTRTARALVKCTQWRASEKLMNNSSWPSFYSFTSQSLCCVIFFGRISLLLFFLSFFHLFWWQRIFRHPFSLPSSRCPNNKTILLPISISLPLLSTVCKRPCAHGVLAIRVVKIGDSLHFGQTCEKLRMNINQIGNSFGRPVDEVCEIRRQNKQELRRVKLMLTIHSSRRRWTADESFSRTLAAR